MVQLTCTSRIFLEYFDYVLHISHFKCPKTKNQLHWPITKDTENPVIQSQLEANACSWHKAWVNVRERGTMILGFTSDWLRKWRDIFKSYQSPSVVMQNQSKSKLLSVRQSSDNRAKQQDPKYDSSFFTIIQTHVTATPV